MSDSGGSGDSGSIYSDSENDVSKLNTIDLDAQHDKGTKNPVLKPKVFPGEELSQSKMNDESSTNAFSETSTGKPKKGRPRGKTPSWGPKTRMSPRIRSPSCDSRVSYEAGKGRIHENDRSSKDAYVTLNYGPRGVLRDKNVSPTKKQRKSPQLAWSSIYGKVCTLSLCFNCVNFYLFLNTS